MAKQSILNKQPEKAFYLHMADYIVAYSKKKSVRLSFLKVKYNEREVVYYEGFLLAKKDSKKIYYVKAPWDFNNSSEYFSVYESSKGLIKDFSTPGGNKFYLVDETGSIKILSLELQNDFNKLERLKIKKNYSVDKNFVGGFPFSLSDSMLYTGFTGYLLKDYYNKDETENNYDITFQDDLVPLGLPLVSNNTIVFIGQGKPKKKSNKIKNDGVSRSKRIATLMPLFNSSRFSILDRKYRDMIRNEFFFKLPNSNEELIVYQLHSKQKIEFQFYKTNGQYVNSIDLKIPGVENHKESVINLSPNGALLFYK